MKYLKFTLYPLLFLFTLPFAFANQSIESEGQVLQIDKATICLGSSVTMQVPPEAIEDDYIWSKENVAVGIGSFFSIASFSAEDAGVYTLTQNYPDGTYSQTVFTLNHISLGEDRSECEAQTIEFNFAEGPAFTWSNGSTSNTFTVTFEESGTISVSAITEFGCLIEDELNVEIKTLSTELSLSPIEENCCQSFLNLNVEASHDAYPVLVYADFQGEQTLLAQFESGGAESFVRDMGAYSNVYVLADNGCLLELDDFTIENQGPFFEGPYIRSRYMQKGIQEATICQSGSAILFVPMDGEPENVTWFYNDQMVGSGFQYEVEDFSLEAAGTYMASKLIEDETVEEIFFELHYLTLGENMTSCTQLSYEIALPVGPDYVWNDGSVGNSYAQEIGETTTISVTALTEFGCEAMAAKTISVENFGMTTVLDPLSICEGGDIILNAPLGYASYYWSTGETFPEIALAPLSGEEIFVEAFNEDGCSDLFYFIFDFLPEVDIATIQGETTPDCQRAEMHFIVNNPIEEYLPIDILGYFDDQQVLIASLSNFEQTVVLDAGEYEYVRAFAQSGCSASIGSFVVEPDMTPELIEMETVAACIQSTVVLVAPEGYDSYEWNNGDKDQEIETVVMPDETYQVLATKEGECPKLYNYSFDLVTFYASLATTGVSESCGFGTVQFYIDASSEMVFPVEVYAYKDGEEVLVITLEEADAFVSLEEGEYRYTKAKGQSGCAQSLPSFTVVDNYELDLAYEINSGVSSCESAIIDFFVSTNNPQTYPVEVYAEMEGEEYLIAMLFSDSQQVVLDEGTYTSVYGVSNNGCMKTLENFTAVDLMSDAGISVKNPTNPCSDGEIIINTDELNQNAFPMFLTAFYEPVNDFIQIGILTQPNQTFPAQPGAYFNIQLHNQFGCAVNFAQFEIQPHENPCTEPEAKPSGSIEDFVFFDKNENGIFDNGDYGVQDVRISAVNRDGQIVKSGISQPDGRFLIDDIPVGEYYLHFDLPSALGFTMPNVGIDESKDSDVDHSNGPATTPYLDISTRSIGSGFTAGVGAFVLPVSWATISAQNNGDYNTVEWSTASEDDVDYFVVERRLNDENEFEAMDHVASIGTVYQGARYAYDDDELESVQLVYYRIKSVDFDGSTSYSKTVVVTMESKRANVHLSVFPNPTSDFINLELTGVTNDAQPVINIFNEVGELVLIQQNTVSHVLQIGLEDLESGTYMVQTIIDNQRFSKKIVVIK